MPPPLNHRLVAGIVGIGAATLYTTPAFAQSPPQTEGGLHVGASVLLVEYHGGTLDLGLSTRAVVRFAHNAAIAADVAYVAAREGNVCPPFAIVEGCDITRAGLVFAGGGPMVLLPRESVVPYFGASFGWRLKKSAEHDGWVRSASPSLYAGVAFPVTHGSLLSELRVRGERESDSKRMRWPALELAFGVTKRAR